MKVEAARQIPLSRPDVGPLEEEYVLAALRSGVLGLGPYARNFEKEFAAFCGCEHAVAVSSGTAGLHLLVRAAGIGAGDEVVTAPISFVASANVMLYEGATPVFADVDPDTFVLDPAAVEAAITPRTRGDPARPRLRLPVRHGGARTRSPTGTGSLIIEDACEAIGACAAASASAASGDAGGVRVLPEQADDDGRGRHGHDRRPRPRRAGALALEPGPLGHGRLARARPARLQLPHGRALGGGRRSRRPSASTRSSPRAPRSPRATTCCSATIDGVSIPAPTAPGDVRSWFVYVVRLDAAIDRDAVMAAMQARGRRVQAVPARRAPAAVLPEPRAPAGRVPGRGGDRALHARPAVPHAARAGRSGLRRRLPRRRPRLSHARRASAAGRPRDVGRELSRGAGGRAPRHRLAGVPGRARDLARRRRRGAAPIAS